MGIENGGGKDFSCGYLHIISITGLFQFCNVVMLNNFGCVGKYNINNDEVKEICKISHYRGGVKNFIKIVFILKYLLLLS